MSIRGLETEMSNYAEFKSAIQKYGFSLNIVDIDPSYSLGEFERIKQETIKQLEADGLIDVNIFTPGKGCFLLATKPIRKLKAKTACCTVLICLLLTCFKILRSSSAKTVSASASGSRRNL